MPFVEVPKFIESLRATDAFDSTKRALEFLILTATRSNEVLGAKWSEFDLGNATWTVPPTRMKSKKLHRVPLTERCMQILQECREQAPSEYVFAGQKEGKPLSSMVFLMLLRRLNLEVTTHGFRSAFRIWAAESTSYPREIAELALAHVNKDRTEAAYQRSDLFIKRRKLMEEWGAFVTASPVATAKKVVGMRK